MKRWVKIDADFFDDIDGFGFRKEPEYVSFVLFCITKANPYPSKWKTMELNRGEFVTSIKRLSDSIGISIQKCRTIIKKLTEYGFITTKSTNEFTIIKLCNYGSYQDKNSMVQQTNNKPTTNAQQTNNKPTTNAQQTDNNPITTDIEYRYTDNKNKEDKNKDSFFKKGDEKKIFQIPQSIEELKEMLSKEKIYMTEQGYAKFFELNQDERYGFKGGVANTARKFLKREENAAYRSFPPNSARPPQAAAQNNPPKPQPDPQAVQLWNAIKSDIRDKAEIGVKDFNDYIEWIKPLAIKNTTLIISVPNATMRDDIEERFIERMSPSIIKFGINSLNYIIIPN
jgi:hypothetical protein